jgi:hypothetical protein
MAKIIEAPQEYNRVPSNLTIFLAGGITNVPNWQKEVCDVLMEKFADKPLVIFNPRRENFPMSDPTAAQEQIKWEYDMLEKSYIFSMFFSAGESDQPICMFEYGKYLERSQWCPNWDLNKRFVVTAEKDYKRYQDVMIQTLLVNPLIKVNTTLQEHINDIVSKIEQGFSKVK